MSELNESLSIVINDASPMGSYNSLNVCAVSLKYYVDDIITLLRSMFFEHTIVSGFVSNYTRCKPM